MSVAQAKAFIEKLGSDEALRKQVDEAENNAARLALAKQAGFDFTAEEMNSAIDELSGEELSDDELEAVAGGANYFKNVDGLSKWKVEEGESVYDKSSPLL